MRTSDWAEFDAKHVVLETRHLSAAQITELTERAAEEIGMRKSTVVPSA